MGNDNTSDFDSLFAESTAEVEAGGGVDAAAETKKQNAKIHLGDGEVNDPQAEILDADEEYEGDETDENPDTSEEGEDPDDDDVEDSSDEFDIASHKDELVKVKVDGKEVSVPLNEALNGYMRQADYTRKTQQIAELKAAADWGKQMRDALLEDPKGVIEALAQSFGLQTQVEAEADIYTTDDPELAPVLKELKATKAELRELRERAERSDQAATEAEVRREMAEVQAKHPDFDPHEVLPEAIRLKVGIEEAYFIVKGRTGRTTEVAKAKVTDAATKAANAEAKRRKLEKIASNSTKKAAESGPADDKNLDFADMLQLALTEAKK